MQTEIKLQIRFGDKLCRETVSGWRASLSILSSKTDGPDKSLLGKWLQLHIMTVISTNFAKS